MRIKPGFVLHTMGQEHVVVAVEERTADFCGMIRLNSTGAFLWKCMEHECTEVSLADALVAEYGISRALAGEAVSSFLKQLDAAQIVEA